MQSTSDNSANNEPSGLYDLRALASSAKKRRSQRVSGQMQAQESLLRSSASLDAVVLPEPGKEAPAPVIAPVASAAMSPSAGAAIAEPTRRARGTEAPDSIDQVKAVAAAPAELAPEKKSGKGLIVGLLAACAIAAGAYVYTSSSKTESASTAEVAEADLSGSDNGAGDNSGGDQAAVGLDDETAPALVDEEAEAEEQAEAPEVEELAAVTKDEPAAEEEPSKEVAKKNQAEDSKDKRRVEEAKSDDDKKQKAANADESKAKSEDKVVKAPEEKKQLDPEAAAIDDVLSSVTGGANTRDEGEEEEAAPSKQRLERSDVNTAMKAVEADARACYSAEEFSGVVKVKYSVTPEGKITKIAVSGKHASTPTGACVAKAVGKASFPAFAGSPMSFTYPFLLSP